LYQKEECLVDLIFNFFRNHLQIVFIARPKHPNMFREILFCCRAIIQVTVSVMIMIVCEYGHLT